MVEENTMVVAMSVKKNKKKIPHTHKQDKNQYTRKYQKNKIKRYLIVIKEKRESVLCVRL
jgi:hypothetical protein